jgi:5-keto-L-gluconate epimerase
MKIAIGSDHVGFPLKEEIAAYLRTLDVEVIDEGPVTAEVAVDYPDYARKIAMSVSSGVCDRGIAICGTGVGISIAVNKYPGIRAVLCDSVHIARQSRIHNDTNVLAMGALITEPAQARQYVDAWLKTAFAGGRHLPRLAKLDVAFQQGWQDLSTLDRSKIKLGIALSPRKSVFGPLMYAGDLTAGLRAAAETGFDAVEISMRVPGDLQLAPLQKELLALGLDVCAIATGQSCLHDGLCLAAADDEKRAGAVARIKGHVDFAAELGAKVILGGIRGRFTGPDEQRDNLRKSAIAAVAVCAEYAGNKGVHLLLEPVNRYETNWINSVNDGLQLIEEIGSPALQLLPDTYHMNIEARDMLASLSAVCTHIGYVHFSDSNRLAPGQGHINFPAVLKTLIENGYEGTITSEILPLPSDLEAMQQAAGYLRALLHD